MSDINLSISAGESKRLLTSGKYCPDNIVITASGVAGGIDTSDATAVAGDLLLGKTAYANGQKLTGTIENRGKILSTITPVGDTVISSGAGYYSEINVGVSAADVTVTPEKYEYNVSSMYDFYKTITVEAIPDKYQDITNVTAGAADVLQGKTIANYAGDVEGTMPNNGAVTATVGAGQTYTIPEGYHNGSGTVTGSSGSSGGGIDTSDATATAADILSPKTAYVNGTKLTGSMVNRGDYTLTVTPSSPSVSNSAGYYSRVSAMAYTTNKTVIPTKSSQYVTGGSSFLASVMVDPIPDAYQDVSSVTAAAADVLFGKKIVAADGTVTTGTMANNGDVSASTANATYNIPAGYTTGGTITFTGDGGSSGDVSLGCFEAFDYGEVTIATTNAVDVTHGMGVTPDVAFVICKDALPAGTTVPRAIAHASIVKDHCSGSYGGASWLRFMESDTVASNMSTNYPATSLGTYMNNTKFRVNFRTGTNSATPATYVWFCAKFKEGYTPT